MSLRKTLFLLFVSTAIATAIGAIARRPAPTIEIRCDETRCPIADSNEGDRCQWLGVCGGGDRS